MDPLAINCWTVLKSQIDELVLFYRTKKSSVTLYKLTVMIPPFGAEKLEAEMVLVIDVLILSCKASE